MEELLKKLRKINEMLQKEGGFVTDTVSAPQAEKELPFSNMATVLGNILQANTYLIDETGNLLGFSEVIDINNERIRQMLVDKKFPEEYVRQLAGLKSTMTNIDIMSDMTAFPIEMRELLSSAVTTIIPIYAAGKRLGSLLFARVEPLFESSDLILAEHGATVIGVELLHAVNLRTQRSIRVNTLVHIAMNSLSYSETEALKAIFSGFDELEQRITASKIAAQFGITRSVIVNALRKLESAGIIEARSLGMKGTYIRVLSKEHLETIKQELTQI